jgi:hypothetical protein
MNNQKEPKYESVDIDSELADLKSKFENTPVSDVDTSSELLTKHDLSENQKTISQITSASFPEIKLPDTTSKVIREKVPAPYTVITEITTARSNAADQKDQSGELPQNLQEVDANSMLKRLETVVQPISNIEGDEDTSLLDPEQEVLYNLLYEMGKDTKKKDPITTPEPTQAVEFKTVELDLAKEIFNEGLEGENPTETPRFALPPTTGFCTIIPSNLDSIAHSNKPFVEAKNEPYNPQVIIPSEGEIPLSALLQEMRGVYNVALQNPIKTIGVVTSLSAAWLGASFVTNINKPKDTPKAIENQQGEVKPKTKPEEKIEANETKPENGLFLSKLEFQKRYTKFYQAMEKIQLKDPKAKVGLYRAQDINSKKKHFYPVSLINEILNADSSKITTLTIDKTKVKITPTGKLFALSLGPTESDMEPNKQGGVVFTKKDVNVPFYKLNAPGCFTLIQLCLPNSAGRTYEETLLPWTINQKLPSPTELNKDLSLQIGVATAAFDMKSKIGMKFKSWRKKIVYGEEVDFAQMVAAAANGWIGFCPVPQIDRINGVKYPKNISLANLGRNCGGGVPGVDYAKSSRMNMEMFLGDGITVIVNGKKQQIQF